MSFLILYQSSKVYHDKAKISIANVKKAIFLCPNRQALKRSAAGVPLAVDIGAFFVSCKCFLRRLDVAVYLPAADTFAFARALLDKAANVLGRIAEKKTYLMRKLLALAYAARQMCQTAGGSLGVVAALAKQAASRGVTEIARKAGGAVDIYQRTVVSIAKRQGAQPLWGVKTVEKTYALAHLVDIFIFIGKHTCRFQARERWRAVTDDAFFGHDVPPWKNVM